jgi:hypothetical protein
MLDSLVGGIAHEINNKLSPIIGFSELLMSIASKSPPGEILEFSSIIRQSATDSAKIISQLLQLSRPSSAERTVCDLAAVVDDSLAILRLKLRAIGAQLDWTPPPQPVAVLADISQLKQVIINLVFNAVDAMEQAPLRTLRIGIERNGEQILSSSPTPGMASVRSISAASSILSSPPKARNAGPASASASAFPSSGNTVATSRWRAPPAPAPRSASACRTATSLSRRRSNPASSASILIR